MLPIQKLLSNSYLHPGLLTLFQIYIFSCLLNVSICISHRCLKLNVSKTKYSVHHSKLLLPQFYFNYILLWTLFQLLKPIIFSHLWLCSLLSSLFPFLSKYYKLPVQNPITQPLLILSIIFLAVVSTYSPTTLIYFCHRSPYHVIISSLEIYLQGSLLL